MEHSSDTNNITGSPTYMLGQIDSNVKQLLHHASGHEKRLHSLEKFRWLTVGGAFVSYAVIKMPWITSAIAAIFH